MLFDLDKARRHFDEDVRFGDMSFRDWFGDNIFDDDRAVRNKMAHLENTCNDLYRETSDIQKAYSDLFFKVKKAKDEVSDPGMAERQAQQYSKAVKAMETVKGLLHQITRLCQNY